MNLFNLVGLTKLSSTGLIYEIVAIMPNQDKSVIRCYSDNNLTISSDFERCLVDDGIIELNLYQTAKFFDIEIDYSEYISLKNKIITEKQIELEFKNNLMELSII